MVEVACHDICELLTLNLELGGGVLFRLDMDLSQNADKVIWSFNVYNNLILQLKGIVQKDPMWTGFHFLIA